MLLQISPSTSDTEKLVLLTVNMQALFHFYFILPDDVDIS